MAPLPSQPLTTTASEPLAKQFDEIIRPHVTALYTSAYRLVGNRPDAEDLVQDILIKLFPRTQEMLEIQDLRPWLLRVLYNQFVDFTRQRARTPKTVQDDDLLEAATDPTPNPEQLSSKADLSKSVTAALAGLPDIHRALVSFHLLDGHTLEELTEVFDVPIGTLKSRLHRAKAALKVILSPTLAEWTLFK